MSTASSVPPVPRPRFSWPMRLFLGIIVFDLVYSNLAALTPVSDWCDELGMMDLPPGLPGSEERAELAGEASPENPHPVRKRVVESLDSLGVYFNPWPNADVRRNINNPLDAGKYVHCWIASRLEFFENLALAKQGWTMFAPNVAKFDVIVRPRLVYADGSEMTVGSIADRINPARQEVFRGFLSEKRVEYSTGLVNDPFARLGFCNLIAHNYPENGAGSPLVKILLIRVRYDYPPPSADVRSALEAQSVPLGQERNSPFFEYDVRTRTGRMTGWWMQLFSS